MKNLIKRLVDVTIVPLVEYTQMRVRTRNDSIVSNDTVPNEVLRRAIADSADYADSHMREALCIRGGKKELWRYAFAQQRPDGLLVEFGVFRGESIRFIASLTQETIYGFDSFEGLREDWKGWAARKGTFDVGGALPRIPANVVLIKGWFDETLPAFLREHREPFSFVHVDCDTYEATSSLLSLAGDRLRPGTVIVFDEYFGYRGWREGEWKAWREFVSTHAIGYRYMAFHEQAVALLLT